MKRALAFSMALMALGSGAARAALPEVCKFMVDVLHWPTPEGVDPDGPLPMRDYVDIAKACRRGAPDVTPAPKSAWLEAERKQARATLSLEPADILVVPFQVQSYGIDHVGRGLMTLELAAALAREKRLRVADPRFASLALGEGMRRFDQSAVSELAVAASARYALVGYVGHDLHHQMLLTLQLFEVRPGAMPGAPPGSTKVWQRDWRSIPFTDESPPEFAFRKMLPDILAALPPIRGKAIAAPGKAKARSGLVWDAPQKLVSRSSEQSPDPAALLMFGVLTTSRDELPAQRLFERALLAALDEGAAPGDRLFVAPYALMALHRRPTALAMLGDEASAESQTLRALLNGNLPDAESHLPGVQEPRRRLMLGIAVRDLQISYKNKERVALLVPKEAFGDSVPEWQALVALREDERDGWSVNEAIDVKRALDRALPVAGLDLRSVAEGQVVVGAGSVDDVDLDVASVRQLHAVTSGLKPQSCCGTQYFRLTQADLVDLYAGLVGGRIAKSLSYVIGQGLYDDAVQASDRYQRVMDGAPLLAVQRARAAQAMAKRSPEDARASWQKEAADDAALAGYAAQGQNWLGATAALVETAAPWIITYGYDYPRRSFWPLHADSVEQRTAWALEALAYATSVSEAFEFLPPGTGEGHQLTVAETLSERFVGDPARPVAIPQPGRHVELPTGDRLVDLRAALKAGPLNWNNYAYLAWELISEQGDYKGAADMMMTYPPFKDAAPEHPVDVALSAFRAGEGLYEAGQPELARPFLEISANLNTGSQASMRARIMLDTLDGHYSEAAARSFVRAQRYPGPDPYRDYLSLMHVLGQGEAAWRGFSQVMSTFEQPPVWRSALVGHRLAGLDARSLRAWLLRPEIRTAQYQGWPFAQYYAILAFSVDRQPPHDLGALIDQIEGDPVARAFGGFTRRPMPGQAGKTEMLAGSPLRNGKHPALPDGTPIRSDFALFADAYVAMREKEYGESAAKFASLADHYVFEGEAMGMSVPYFAWSAAKSGDKYGLEKYVTDTRIGAGFPYWMALAMFAGARHDVDQATKDLDAALHRRPDSGLQPIPTEYQYAEACELLYLETRDERLRTRLVTWVRHWQVVHPVDAWAYALQYSYDPDPEARQHALAMTLYLDPASPHIRGASSAQVKRARAWLDEHNPFRSGLKAAPVDASLTLAPSAAGRFLGVRLTARAH
jgi:hypothetical protein